MSPLWPDQLGVALFPERLLVARTSGGLRRRLLHKEVLELAPAAAGAPPWQPALDALGARAASAEWAHAELTVVLSSRFVNYAVIPWSDSLRGKDEEAAFARHCFTRVYGSAADAWEIRVASAKPGEPRLACALERPLVDALQAQLGPLARRYRSLRPHLMASFNRWRARVGPRPVWLVVAEPELLCLALLQQGCWHSVRSVKVGADWLQQLPEVLSREECLVESTVQCDDVLLFAPDIEQPLLLESGKWRISKLLPTLLPGMAAGVDAPFSIACGA